MFLKVFSLIFTISFTTAYADTYSLDIQANGVPKMETDTITELLQMNFKNEFGKVHQLVTSEKATYKLKTKILKLDNFYIVNIEKEKDNTYIFSASIKSPKSEELDQKISRLVRSVVKEEAINEKVGETTESEKMEKSFRRQSINRWYVGFGPGTSRKLGNKVTMTNISIGYSWEVSAKASIRALFDSLSEPGANRNSSFSNFGLGLQYFLDDNNNAPYILGDLGRASTTSSTKEEINGFSFGGGIGYTLFRTSSTNFDLELRAQTISSSNKNGTPSTIALRVGVLF